jgi:hypothetical protein
VKVKQVAFMPSALQGPARIIPLGHKSVYQIAEFRFFFGHVSLNNDGCSENAGRLLLTANPVVPKLLHLSTEAVQVGVNYRLSDAAVSQLSSD